MSLQDLVNASTGICQLDAVTYTLTSAVTIDRPLVFQGQGPKTQIVVSSSQDGLVITTTDQVVLRDFSITSTALKSGGYGIKFASTGLNSNSRLANLRVINQYIGIGMLNAYYWALRDCNIEGSASIGIEISNPLLVDAGDALVTGCVLNSTQPQTNAIVQRSGGGLKLIGNKILQHRNGYAMAMDGVTSVLVISGNSIEGQEVYPIVLTATPNGNFANVTITGNEFAVNAGGIVVYIVSSSWCDRVVITGNVGVATGATFTNINVPNAVIANNLVF